MKRNTKKLLAIAAALLLICGLLACTGCGAAAKNAAQDQMMLYDESNMAYAMEEAVTEAAGNGKSAVNASAAAGNADAALSTEMTEKIIRTVDLTVQTETFDDYFAALNAAITAAGGYAEESSSNSGGYYGTGYRSAFVVARIPTAALDAFLAKAGDRGVIVNREESAANVTLDYVDLESRISAYQTEQTTLMGLLEKATSLEDILKIQERLSKVNYELESYTAKLRLLENRVSYSTVTLEISEVHRALREDDSLGTRIKNRYLENWDSLKEGLKSLLVGLIGGLPILVPLAIAAAIAIVVFMRLAKKRRAKKLARRSDPTGIDSADL